MTVHVRPNTIPENKPIHISILHMTRNLTLVKRPTMRMQTQVNLFYAIRDVRRHYLIRLNATLPGET